MSQVVFALHAAIDAAGFPRLERERAVNALSDSLLLDDLELVAATDAGRNAIVRSAAFGYEYHGDDVFRAVARDHLEQPPQRSIRPGASVADEVGAARSFLLTELGRIWGTHMEAMFASVDEAIASGRSLTLSERNFLDHELLEASYVAAGMSQRAAHDRVHESIPPGANFSPHVIVEFQDRFGPQNFVYWGLTKGGR